MANLFQPSLTRATDSNGNPMSGAKMYFYLTESLILSNVFTSVAATTEHTNPVVSDSTGIFPPVYVDNEVTYRVRLTSSNGALIVWDIDPVPGVDAGAISSAAATATAAAAAAAASETNAAASDAAAENALDDITALVSELTETARVEQRLAVLEDAVKDILPTLTTVGATYHAIYSTTRLVPTYSGPAFRAIRNSDDVAVDVNYTGKTVAKGDISLLRGSGSALRLDKWYDQSGNSRDMTQTTAGTRPGVHEDAYIAGSPVIFIDGERQFNGIGSSVARGFDFTHALTGQACTLFVVTDQNAGTQQQLILAYAGSVSGRTFYHDAPALNVVPGNAALAAIIEFSSAGTVGWPGKQFRTAPAVYALREQVGPTDLFIDGVAYPAKAANALTSTGATPTAEDLTTGHLGYATNPALDDFYSNMRILAFVAVAGTLSTADVLAVSTALRSNFQAPSRYTSRVVIVGDSIAEGGGTNTLGLTWHLRQQAFEGLPELYNIGIAGKLMSACYADRTFYDAQLYKTGDPVVYIIQAGTNDLRTGTSAAALNTTLTTYVAYLHALGTNVKVVVNTILKAGINDATQAQRVIDYNVLVRANAAGADVINDIALNETHLAATNAENDTTLLADGIHPTSLEQSYLAPWYAAAINSALP